MYFINSIINFIFDVILYPFRSLGPVWAVIFISFLSGIYILIVFKFFTNQEQLKTTKKKIAGHILELRIFNFDLIVILKILKSIVVTNFKYIRLNALSFIIVAIPLIIVSIQLHMRFNYRAFKIGETASLCVKFKGTTNLKDKNIVLRVPEGIGVETPAIKIDLLNEINWRIKCEREGEFDLMIGIDSQEFKKRLSVNREHILPETYLSSSNAWFFFLNPGAKPLQKEIEASSVSIKYPHYSIVLLGISFNCLVLYFIFSVVFVYLIKIKFKVVI